MAVSWSILTPRGVAGPVGVIGVRAEGDAELRAFLGEVGVGWPGLGAVSHRRLCGIDDGVVVRVGMGSAILMPHGGVAVLRAIAAKLNAAGAAEESARGDWNAAWPEAGSEVEARMLGTLSRAASGRAVEVLLDQPGRWRERRGEVSGEVAAALKRLIEPPTVVAVGGANIGKSTMLNAMAGRRAAIVADEPGTTRDHVGVVVDVDGLCVRLVDTPGVRETGDGLELQAAGKALDVARGADLILWCGTPAIAPLDAAGLRIGHVPFLRVCLKADTGSPAWGADVAVACGGQERARRDESVAELAGAIRRALVPDEALNDAGAWRFWDGEFNGDFGGEFGVEGSR
jgi:tRNA modification GTPase